MSLPYGLQWVQSSSGQHVPGGVIGGSYENTVLYIGRAYHAGDLTVNIYRYKTIEANGNTSSQNTSVFPSAYIINSFSPYR